MYDPNGKQVRSALVGSRPSVNGVVLYCCAAQRPYHGAGRACRPGEKVGMAYTTAVLALYCIPLAMATCNGGGGGGTMEKMTH